jgi:hypothetical protein
MFAKQICYENEGKYAQWEKGRVFDNFLKYKNVKL